VKPNSEILLYQTEDGQTKIEVRMEDETVWFTQRDIRSSEKVFFAISCLKTLFPIPDISNQADPV
jgi:hypothetical protein